jgi:hypothetical protein
MYLLMCLKWPPYNSAVSTLYLNMVQTFTKLKVSIYVKWWAKALLYPKVLHLTCILTISPFAFEDPTNTSQQLTWTVLPQWFRDSPHLFEQALTRDLLGWHYPEVTLFQYVDILLCRATEPLVWRVTESFLKLSGLQGYKVSKEKAQLCLP